MSAEIVFFLPQVVVPSTRRGSDNVRRLLAGQLDHRLTIIDESLWARWPAERLLTVSGPFLDNILERTPTHGRPRIKAVSGLNNCSQTNFCKNRYN